MSRKDYPFSLRLYREMLIEARNLGFSFQTFSRYLESPLAKVILIRHDVDVSLKWALEMSRVEHELDVSATYFVRVHSTQYNLFDRHNYWRLHELKNGHFEIGMHQEVRNFAETSEEAIRLMKREKRVIESILGCSVNGVATHIPSHNLLSITPEILQETGFRYVADGAVFNNNATFVSDSNNHWKKYSFSEALRMSNKILANIHPIWWVGNIDDTEAMIKFLREGN